MNVKKRASKLQKSTRFCYILHKNAKLQTFTNQGDWRDMHAKATSALATWAKIYAYDDLTLWATDKEWK